MPFALDDLDSNCLHYLVMITSYAHGSATFVSMFGEDCMLGEGVEGVGEMDSNSGHSMQKILSAA